MFAARGTVSSMEPSSIPFAESRSLFLSFCSSSAWYLRLSKRFALIIFCFLTETTAKAASSIQKTWNLTRRNSSSAAVLLQLSYFVRVPISLPSGEAFERKQKVRVRVGILYEHGRLHVYVLRLPPSSSKQLNVCLLPVGMHSGISSLSVNVHIWHACDKVHSSWSPVD
jgi:hypothetical protein